MSGRRLTPLLGPLLAAVYLAGCASVEPTAEAPTLDGSVWVLSALPGHAVAAGSPASLRFEAGRVSGSDGCNRFSGPYTARGGTLALAPGGAAATRMACPTEVMQQADAFMAALAAARSYRVDGQQLWLLAADGSPRATLAAASQALAGTRWQATAINNGQGAVSSVLAGSAVTIEFRADGSAAGSAGCNGYTARYAQDGAQLRVQPPAATRKQCPGDALMQQEQAFLQALQSVATLRLAGPRLELRTGSGALAVTLVRDGAP